MSRDTTKNLDTTQSELDTAPQKNRVPMHRQTQGFIRKEEGYFYYGFPNTRYVTDKALLAGYEFVTEDMAQLDSTSMNYSSSKSKYVTCIANPRMRDETPLTAREFVFMRIREDLHEQDMLDQAVEADTLESQMTPATLARKDLGMYQDYQRQLK